jgi:L-rhamnose isomerase
MMSSLKNIKKKRMRRPDSVSRAGRSTAMGDDRLVAISLHCWQETTSAFQKAAKDSAGRYNGHRPYPGRPERPAVRADIDKARPDTGQAPAELHAMYAETGKIGRNKLGPSTSGMDDWAKANGIGMV